MAKQKTTADKQDNGPTKNNKRTNRIMAKRKTTKGQTG